MADQKITTFASADSPKRLRIEIGGAVQGVGFRPFVYRTATRLGIGGWVRNSPTGVVCEAEAGATVLDHFLEIIQQETPPLARIEDFVWRHVDPTGSNCFDILTTGTEGSTEVLVLPDVATCQDCRDDIFDPQGRRFQYPFTNCTNCGPRYSILEKIPYDRANTSMAAFALCPACQSEYADPHDRRFHAQPNCCPDCGPQLAWWDSQGRTLATRHDALLCAAAAIRDGEIVAIKGIGGFLLFADARNAEATIKLRERKHRPHKPFAIMVPNLRAAKRNCHVSAEEAALLASPQSPIVLLQRCQPTPDGQVCDEVAPGSPDLGVMLPYAPLHHILMQELGFAVVATSGNLSNEPLAVDNLEALDRLANLADTFLVHDRPILRPVDDSVVRVMGATPMVLRRARGYSPYPLALAAKAGLEGPTILAVGAHLGNTVTLLRGNSAHIGPHIGDLETPEAIDAFERSIHGMCNLIAAEPDAVTCDLHSDYSSSQYARATALPVLPVQHHVAHIAACMGEHGLEEPVLGVAWDGAGLGDDGTLWGGEFFYLTPDEYQRIASFRNFPLPGGAAAIREPRRSALGVLWALDGDLNQERSNLAPVADFTEQEFEALRRVLSRRVNSPQTSAAGRLFDAASALTGLRLRATYQGQAAAELEWAISGVETDESYPFDKIMPDSSFPHTPLALDWRPMMRALIEDIARVEPVPVISARFHNTLVEMIASVVEWQQMDKVVFSGGCFQNKYLVERLMRKIQLLGVTGLFPRNVPPNDGGISFGQAIWARNALKGA